MGTGLVAWQGGVWADVDGVAVPIPSYEDLMLPVLRLSAEKTWLMRDLIDRVIEKLALSEQERREQLPSGGASVIGSRVGWAKTYMKQAGLLEQPRRAHVQITPAGRAVLASAPQRVDGALLRTFPAFQAFLKRTKVQGDNEQRSTSLPDPVVSIPSSPEPTSTPEEMIATASLTLDETVRDALLARILEGTPAFFEKLIVDLLLQMGYGGSRSDAGEQLGGTGDGGVDGVIREDQLGLDRIYLQAK